MPIVSLNEEFPNIPTAQSTFKNEPGTIDVSKTASGLHIASDSTSDKVNTIGIYSCVGSMYENENTSGLSHLMHKMAFQSTLEKSDLRFFRDVEQIGGSIRSEYGRDFVSMQIQVTPEHLEKAAELLAQTVVSPRYALWDVRQQKEKVLDDAFDNNSNPMVLLSEGLHAAAYYDTETLGRPTYDAENLDVLTPEVLKQAHGAYFNAKSMVVVGTGMEHGELFNVSNQYFTDVAASGMDAGLLEKKKVQYVGGESRNKVKIGQTGVSIGFEGASWKSKDLPASFVLQSVLGQQVKEMEGMAFNAVYLDSGVIGVTGYAEPQGAQQLVDHLLGALKGAGTTKLSDEQLNAAKMITATTYAQNMEKRSNRFSVLGSMLFNDNVATVAQVVDSIQTVSSDDVLNFAQTMLKSKPSIASVGNVAKVPRYNQILEKLQ